MFVYHISFVAVLLVPNEVTEKSPKRRDRIFIQEMMSLKMPQSVTSL